MEFENSSARQSDRISFIHVMVEMKKSIFHKDKLWSMPVSVNAF